MQTEQLDLFGGATLIETPEYLPQIDLKALYAFAEDQAQLHWQREFDIEIELVNRMWWSRLACYSVNLNTGRKRIKMSIPRNKLLAWEEVKGNLLHELVHWHLHTSGLPYRDDDIEFAQECLRVGAPFSGTQIAQRTAKVAMTLQQMGEKHE